MSVFMPDLPELSKRIDDLHRRFEDLRAEMGTRFADLRAELDVRFSAIDHRLTGIDQRFTSMDQRFQDLGQRLTTLTWIISGWFTFLTLVLALFAFLRR